MDIIVAGGRKEEKEEEEKSYPLPRRRREKEGGEAAPTKRGEKEAEREREGRKGEWGCTRWRQRDASIHIHPGVATGALITCFNLPTADWASICHSKSVIAPGTAAEGSPSNPLQPP